MSDLSNDTIIISGITKFAVPVIAFFIIRAAKDIVSQWLENQRVMFTTTHTVLQCACDTANNQKEPTEPTESITQPSGSVVQSATSAQTASRPSVQTPRTAPSPLIIDNYSQRNS